MALRTIEQLTTWNAQLLELANWHPTVVAYGGYGSQERARVQGRVLMGTRSDQRNWLGEKRGWRQYFDAQVPGQPVLVRLGEAHTVAEADRGGYVDVVLERHGLTPGWHTAQIQVLHRHDLAAGRSPVRASRPVLAPVRIIGPDEQFGVITDVDDTIMVTMVPQRLQALRYVLLEHSSQRRAVPGMAPFLHELSQGAPVIYLSNGAWNVAPTLRRFLHRAGFPSGSLQLRPWGISRQGFPLGGFDNKVTQFKRVAEILPHLHWALVGDDGERDPRIYQHLAQTYPGTIRAIFLRTLKEHEHLAVHGTLRPIDPDLPETLGEVPTRRGRDGHELLAQLTPELRRKILSWPCED